jgi:hypothetical protein
MRKRVQELEGGAKLAHGHRAPLAGEQVGLEAAALLLVQLVIEKSGEEGFG